MFPKRMNQVALSAPNSVVLHAVTSCTSCNAFDVLQIETLFLISELHKNNENAIRNRLVYKNSGSRFPSMRCEHLSNKTLSPISATLNE